MFFDLGSQDSWRARHRGQPSKLATSLIAHVGSLVGTGTAVERRCQAQIRDPELRILPDQKVGDLDVPVGKAILMDGLNSSQKLKEKLKSMQLLEPLGVLKVVFKVKFLSQLHRDVEHSSLFDLLDCEWPGLSET